MQPQPSTTAPDADSLACPICGSDTRSLESVDYRECPSCRARVSTAPEGRYDSDYYFHDRANEARQRERAQLQVRHLRRLLSEVDDSHQVDTPRAVRVLELGCSKGFFVEEAVVSGFDAVGVDVSEVAVEHGRRRGLGDRVFAADARYALPEACGEGFDVVATWELLEHMDSPAEFLEMAASHLRPGGWLVGSTPNGDSTWVDVLGPRWHGFGIPEYHRVYLNPEAFRVAAERAGLDATCTVTTTEPSGRFLLKNVATACAERLTGTRNNLVRAGLALTLAVPEWVAEHTAGHVPGLQGDTLLFAARKPLA
ncbi:MAG: class I SAM-dependent methyltransferase [Planctomycetota bacterium]